MWADNPYDRESPQSAYPSGLAASYAATGFLRVYGWSVYNSNAASQYVLLFDASTLPGDGAVPILPFQVPSKGSWGAYYGPMGRVFRRGLVLCNSSTDTTKTIGSADCFFDVQFDNLPNL